MEKQNNRRAWAFLIVLGSVIAAAAAWNLPDERDFYRNFSAEPTNGLNRHD
jgi:hypothetical protein